MSMPQIALSDMPVALEGAGRPELDRRHPLAIYTLVVLVIYTMLSYADRMVIVLLVEPIRADLNIGDFEISLLTGVAFALCFGFASLPLGWLADRHSRRWVIFGGVTAWSLATASCGIAADFGQMFLSRFMVGVGEAALAPAAFALLPDLFPRRQVAMATSILAAAAALGAGMALIGGGILIAWSQSIGVIDLPVLGIIEPWRLVFLILAVIGLLLAPLIFIAPEMRHRPMRDAAKAAAPSRAAFLLWLRENWVFVAGLSVGCSALSAVAYGAASWTPTYLSRVLALDIPKIAFTLGLIQMISGTAGYLVSGAVVGWMNARGMANASHRYLSAVAIVCALSGFGAFVLARDVWTVMVCLTIFNLACPFSAALVTGLQMGTPRAYRGRAIGLSLMLVTPLGLIVGPSGMALVTEQGFGDPKMVGHSVAIVSAICCAIAILSLVLSYRASKNTIARTQAAEAPEA